MSVIVPILLLVIFKSVQSLEECEAPDLSMQEILMIQNGSLSGCRFVSCACSVNCFGVPKDVRREVKSTLKKHILSHSAPKGNCSSLTSLIIRNSVFRKQELDFEWLHTSVKIYEFEVTDSKIKHIQPEAFNSFDFLYTFSIKLEHVSVRNLEGGALLGLTKLEFLTIVAPVHFISRSFLQPVRTSLKHLKLSEMTKSVKLSEIFGVSSMSNLRYLDLSGNNFGDISDISFLKNLPVLRSLKLTHSNVKSLQSGKFKSYSEQLRTVDLSYNHLKTIDPKLFSIFYENRRTFFYLGNNPWACDCRFEKFVSYVRENSEMFVDQPLCKEPQKFKGRPISLVKPYCTVDTTALESASTTIDLHESTLGSTSSSVDKIWDVVTTQLPDPEDVIHFKCPGRVNHTSRYDETILNHLHIAPPLYEFYVTQAGATSVRVTVEEFQEVPIVVWYNDQFQQSTDCQLYEEHFVLIEGLDQNATYVFCLLPYGTAWTSPLNCQPFFLPVSSPDEDEIWLTEDYKTLLISLYCLVIVSCFCLGGFLSYLVVLREPTLLRGSKHVVIVEEDEYERIYSRRIPPNQPPPYTCLDWSSYEVPDHIYDGHPLRNLTYLDNCPETPPPLPRRNSLCEGRKID